MRSHWCSYPLDISNLYSAVLDIHSSGWRISDLFYLRKTRNTSLKRLCYKSRIQEVLSEKCTLSIKKYQKIWCDPGSVASILSCSSIEPHVMVSLHGNLTVQSKAQIIRLTQTAMKIIGVCQHPRLQAIFQQTIIRQAQNACSPRWAPAPLLRQTVQDSPPQAPPL